MTEVLGPLMRSTVWLSAGIVLVLAARVPVRRLFGARAAYALWLVPLVVCAASLLPPPEVSGGRSAVGSIESVLPTVPPALPRTIASAESLVLAPFADQAEPAPAALASGLTSLWGAGALASLALLVLRQRRFVAALGAVRPEPGGHPAVFRSNAVAAGPVLVGVFRPRVVLPADFETRFSPDERPLVVAHELAHLRAGDARVNAAVAVVRALYWFNPLVLAAGRLIRLDQELSCDAAVVAREPQCRRHYANAMVKAQQLEFSALPLAPGWTAWGRHPVARRLAMLKRAVPGRARQWVGAAAAVSLAAACGLTVWGAQPPRPLPGIGASFQEAGGQPAAPLRAPELHPAPWAAILTAMFPGSHHSLLEAVQENDMDAVRELIAAGANLDIHRPGDGTPLVEAARRGNVAMVTLLLDHGADPNVPAPGDGNALIMAAAGGHAEVVTLLVRRGADVNGYVPGDETPLINAAGGGHLAVVQYLVQHGADVNLAFDVRTFRGTTERRSPLSQAIKGGHREVADFLRSVGANQ